jgi:phosphohistidine phosphatase
MTLRLILMRHAKSDWDNPLDTDHQRPLAPRGLRAAPAMGGWLAQNGYLPDQALVSDAMRTRQTWAFLSAELPTQPEVSFHSDLYHASPDTMLSILRQATGACVLMIGHNPGIAELAQRLVAIRPTHPAFARYPTGATLIADFDIAIWADLTLYCGNLVNFVVPRDLD